VSRALVKLKDSALAKGEGPTDLLTAVSSGPDHKAKTPGFSA
jgi:hypothetical protein